MTCWEAFRESLTYNCANAGANKLSGQMLASETQRIAYLKVMGVQPYFPRRPLPGAKPARHYAEDFLRQSISSESALSPVPASAQEVLSMLVAKPPSEQAVQIQPVEAPQSPQDLAPQASVAARAPRPSNVPPVQELRASEPKNALEGEEVRFVFAYFPINEHFAVINELPWSKSAGVSTSCRKLLADILKALGVEVPERNLNPMVFTWPLFEGTSSDISSNNARKALDGFLAKRLSLLPINTLIVLAEQSAQFLFPVDFLQDRGSRFTHPRHNIEVVLTHSLSAMDTLGKDIKGPAWTILKPLRGQLTGSSGEPQDGVS